jgi:4'-phosphopantetheinyl transferase
MDLYWLEQTEADVPADNDWLSPRESLRLETMRFPKRRADWRLGRWTAKCAVAACLPWHAAPAEIEIRAADCGAPEIFYSNLPSDLRISLSHRDGVACCVVGEASDALGCDLELVEPHSPAFVADYFTPEEQRLVADTCAADRVLLVSLLWSAKESALKALRIGLRADTRSVTVHTPPLPAAGRETWQKLMVSHAGGNLHGWWRCGGNLVRTLVAAPAPGPPFLAQPRRVADHSHEPCHPTREELLRHSVGGRNRQ